MKARPTLRVAGAVITATRIDLPAVDAPELPAFEVSAVSIKTFDQTPEYRDVQPVLLPAGKSKRAWRWNLRGAHIWRITTWDGTFYIETTPSGVARIEEDAALALLLDECAHLLGYPTYQAYQDANAAYIMAREAANREARDEALRKATDYVLTAKWPVLDGSPSEQLVGNNAREGMIRFAKAAVFFDATVLKVSKRDNKAAAAKGAIRALEHCKDAAWFVQHQHALVKPGAPVNLDRVLNKLAALEVPGR
jgi:hypothetical protein